MESQKAIWMPFDEWLEQNLELHGYNSYKQRLSFKIEKKIKEDRENNELK